MKNGGVPPKRHEVQKNAPAYGRGVGAGEHGPSQPKKQALPLEPRHHRHQGKEHPQGVQVHVVQITGVGGDHHGGGQGQHPGHPQHRLSPEPLQYPFHIHPHSFCVRYGSTHRDKMQ